jgi:uncharacterized protein (UPF0332 family)
MSLEQWLSEGKLKPHQTTRQEVSQLLQAVERNIRDASIEALSPDNRFTIAYQAALQLATILLYASGYRPSASIGHHYITIQSLRFTVGGEIKARIHYLDNCRKMRNASEYERAGVVSGAGVTELLEELKVFRQDVLEWLAKFHPDLLA